MIDKWKISNKTFWGYVAGGGRRIFWLRDTLNKLTNAFSFLKFSVSAALNSQCIMRQRSLADSVVHHSLLSSQPKHLNGIER